MMHAFRISECYLDFSCMDAIGPLNLAVFRTDEIHRHNSRPQLCKPINLLQFMRAAQLSYRWNVRLRNVRLTSTRSSAWRVDGRLMALDFLPCPRSFYYTATCKVVCSLAPSCRYYLRSIRLFSRRQFLSGALYLELHVFFFPSRLPNH